MGAAVRDCASLIPFCSCTDRRKTAAAIGGIRRQVFRNAPGMCAMRSSDSIASGYAPFPTSGPDGVRGVEAL